MASTKAPSDAIVAPEKAAKISENKDIAILLKQNWQMEREISRLNHELDVATKGILMRGYLYKFRDREISFASKWALRFFLLQGTSLSYFVDESERRPRRTIDLTSCSIRDEGVTKNGQHYIFSILCADSFNDDIVIDAEYGGNVLLRLSSTSRADAATWVRVLSLACAGDNKEPSASDEQPDIGSNLIDGPELSGSTGLLRSLSMETMRRVQSSTQILQKSLSRLGLTQLDASLGLLISTPAVGPAGNTVTTETVKKSKSPVLPPLSELNETGKHLSKSKDKARLFPGSKPIHMETKASPLSSDNSSRGSERSFRGFFNLGVIILLVANCRLIVDNLQHHGFVTQIPQLGDLGVSNGLISVAILAAQCLGSWFTAIILCYVIEIVRFRRWISESVSVGLHFLFGAINIIVPVMWVWNSNTNPLLSMIYLFESVIIWMKLISYAHVNHDLRQVMRPSSSSGSAPSSSSWSDLRTLDAHTPRGTRPSSTSTDNLRDISRSPSVTYFSRSNTITGKDATNGYGIKDLQPPYLQYPMNLTMSNLLYFCVAPTLCYQLNYPRLSEIRWYYVATILVRLCLFSVFLLFSVQQYIVPALSNSIDGIRSRDPARIAEVVLKISIPNTYSWLLMFYLFFHLWLNLLAELTRFGDRLFYKDWWNSRNISGYWKNWNLPVHNFLLRHLYYPLVNSGVPKGVATTVVFLFSALLHEVVISVPFRHITLHAFFGMMAQAPLITLTRMIDARFDNAFLGNVIFWCLFCIIGQPMGLIMVYYDLWNAKNGTCISTHSC